MLDLKITGNSLGTQPHWPKSRDLYHIFQMHELPNMDIFNQLKPGDTFIDVGCGDGTFASQVKQAMPSVQVYGCGAHDASDSLIDRIDGIYYGCVPEAKELLRDKVSTASLVIDTIGALSYSDNPGEVLIYEAMLCKPQGTLTAVTMGNPNDSAPILGSSVTQERMKKFFSQYFNGELTIKKREFGPQYIVRFTSNGHSYSADQFDHLCKLFEIEVGKPEDKTVFDEFNEKFYLRSRHWTYDPAPNSSQ